jgi:RNA polymerase sigma-70 factor (ECF subfamily)
VLPTEWARLAARAQLGERKALERLLTLLQEPLRIHIARIVHDDEIALDVLQGVLFTVYRRLGTLREPRWIRAWAYRIATRQATRAAVACGRPPVSIEEVADIVDEREPPADDPLLDGLPEALHHLPPAAQTALRLHYLDGLSLREVAEALAVPIGTAKSRVAYGLAQLRQRWLP